MNRPNLPLPRPSEMALAPMPRGIVTPDTARTPALRLDTEAFRMPAEGMARVGEALTRGGEIAAKVAELAEADNSLIAEAETNAIRSIAESQMWEELEAEPDHLKYKDIASRHVDSALARVGKYSMNPKTRSLVDAKSAAWGADLRARVGRESVRDGSKRADAAIVAGMNLAQESGNLELFRTYNSQRTARLKQSEEQAQLNEVRFHERQKEKAQERENEEQKAAVESFTAVAMSNPDAAMGLLDDPEFGAHLKPSTRLLMRGRAEGAIRDQFAAVQGDVFDAITTGADKDGVPVVTPEDVARVAGKRARPHEVKKWQDTLMDYQAEARKAEMAKPENQRALFGELLDRAWKFDREALGGVNGKAARDEYTDILMQAKWLDPVLRGEVSKPLAVKWFAAGPKLSGDVKEYLDASVQDLFKAGAFGQTTKKVLKEPTDEGYAAWEKRYKEVTDDDGLKAARAALADVKIGLQQWLDTEEKAGRKVSRPDATAQLYRITGGKLSEGEMGKIFDAADKKTTAPPMDFDSIRQRLQPPAGAQGDAGPTGAEGAVSESLVGMVKEFEGFSAKAFGDFKQTSIGYGTRARHEGETLSEPEADKRLRQELTMHAGIVDRAASEHGYDLTAEQRDALISFDFNTGRAEYLLETADGDMEEIERRMRLYTKAGGVEQGGLVKRRKKEADMLRTLEYVPGRDGAKIGKIPAHVPGSFRPVELGSGPVRSAPPQY